MSVICHQSEESGESRPGDPESRLQGWNPTQGSVTSSEGSQSGSTGMEEPGLWHSLAQAVSIGILTLEEWGVLSGWDFSLAFSCGFLVAETES